MNHLSKREPVDPRQTRSGVMWDSAETRRELGARAWPLQRAHDGLGHVFGGGVLDIVKGDGFL